VSCLLELSACCAEFGEIAALDNDFQANNLSHKLSTLLGGNARDVGNTVIQAISSNQIKLHKSYVQSLQSCSEGMNYMNNLPEGAVATADWALKLSDETLLPFHSPLLFTISPVAAGLFPTKTEDNGSKYAVVIPFNTTVEVATAFLTWLYRQDLPLTLQYAKEFATLSTHLEH